MWQKRFSKFYKDISAEAVWQAWSNVNDWPKWDQELEYCELNTDFSTGKQFILKPRSGPKVKIKISEVIPQQKFVDRCKFFGAVMHDIHELKQEKNGVSITNTITVTGPLAFIWINLVAKNVAKSIPIQTDKLVEYARNNYE